MTTVRQIAKLANVSICTVSKALRDDPRISAATRERVQAIAQSLYYRPNRLATGLYTGTTSLIGMILPELNTWYGVQILRVLTQECYSAGWNMLVFEHLWHPSLLDELIVQQVERRVQGIILIPGVLPFPKRYLAELGARRIIPVGIDLEQQEHAVDQVRIDEEALAHLAIEYLLHLGHRRIGFVSIEKSKRTGRDLAIRRELARRGLADSRYQFHHSGTQLPDVRRAYSDLLGRSPRPTAVIAWSFEMALSFMQVAAELGISVPQDMSVFSCDNEAYADKTTPPLTCLDVHPEEVGRQAFHLILRRLKAYADTPETTPLTPEIISVKPTLIKRASCLRI
ncbi:MAG TPA: LacI family DNA-binding transcriptional regulator [Candidatus Hydrogenedentes bacterium]|nr:LacI family DNA-binding transcriptional regulator [Candidatus Hydrogenedentota bacterium]